MRDLFEKMAKKSSYHGREPIVLEDFSDNAHDAVSGSSSVIWIYESAWERLTDSEREFAMARGLALTDLSGRSKFLISSLSVLGAYAGCVLGMINLWLIIPAQAMFAIGFLGSSIFSMRKEPLEADTRALVWTRDLESAISYVTSSTSSKSFGPGSNRASRLANLRETARKLEIAS